MKQIILLLALIYFASGQAHDGPAYNIPYRENEDSCENHYVHEGNGEFRGENYGVSACADLNLYSNHKNRYFDKCCYVRFLLEGNMHGGCVGLFRDQIIDITETKKRMEQGDKNIWTSYAANSKIYELDCKGSNIRFLTLALALLSLLF